MLRLRAVGEGVGEDGQGEDADDDGQGEGGESGAERREDAGDDDLELQDQQTEQAEGEEADKVGEEANEDEEEDDEDEEEDGGDVDSVWEEEACDEATWEILEHVLGFRHSFEQSHCPWLLYTALAPALLDGSVDARSNRNTCDDDDDGDDETEDSVRGPDEAADDSDVSEEGRQQLVPKPVVSRLRPFLAE
eukprot:2332443-Rhodomonas_salina.1